MSGTLRPTKAFDTWKLALIQKSLFYTSGHLLSELEADDGTALQSVRARFSCCVEAVSWCRSIMLTKPP